jgi:hypothetical protein
MSLYTFTGQLPKHKYVYVDSSFTHQEPTERFVSAVWYGLVCQHGKAWGCTVMLECGAVYRNLPPHALAFKPEPATNWPVEFAQRWDCYNPQFTTLEYTFLKGQACIAMAGPKDEHFRGEYLFSASHIGDGWTEEPSQNKEFMFIELDNGRLTIQPTNKVTFQDASFVEVDQFPKLKLQTESHSCET